MKSLPTLIKLSKQRVDAQRLRLTKLFEEQDTLKSQVASMESTLKHEATKATEDPTMAMHYGRYAEEMEQRIKHTQSKINDLQLNIELNQDRLSTLFQDQKGLEIFKNQIQQKDKALKEKKTQDYLDEITAQAHQRKKMSS